MYRKRGEDGRYITLEAARMFCQMVDILRNLTGTVVVAGADLNCDIESFDDFQQASMILPYTLTQRRIKRKKIDFILLTAPPGRVVNHHIQALDFMPSNNDTLNALHGIIRGVFCQGQNVAYNIRDYCGRAVDHDPIVCDLTLSR